MAFVVTGIIKKTDQTKPNQTDLDDSQNALACRAESHTGAREMTHQQMVSTRLKCLVL